MSKTNTWIFVVAVVAIAACALFVVPAWLDGDDASTQAEITTLDAWVKLSQRPGFTLLDKADLDEYFITVYRTEANEIALCYRWKAGTDVPDTSFGVRHLDGRSAKDASRGEETTPLNTLGSRPKHGFVNGMVIPISEDFYGPVHVEFLDNHGSPDAIPARKVYTKTFDLGR